MRAIKYKVGVSQSTLDFVHGFTYAITEIWISKNQLVFNIENGLNIFTAKEPREVGGEEIEIDKDIVRKLEEIYVIQEDVKKQKEEICKLVEGIFKETK